MRDQDSNFRTGETIPDFTVTLTDGNRVLLSTLASPLLLINFFSTQCPFCRALLRYLNDVIVTQFGSIGLTILAVGRDHDINKLSAFITSEKYPFLFAADPERELYNRFASRFVPRNYLINGHLELLYQEHGFDPDDPGDFARYLSTYPG